MKVEDTTIGWRFVNPLMKARYGTDSMPETGEIVAEEFHVSRADQDLFALCSQQRAADAMRSGRLAEEITPVCIPQKKGEPVAISQDEHPRPDTTLEALAKLKPAFKQGDRPLIALRPAWRAGLPRLPCPDPPGSGMRARYSRGGRGSRRHPGPPTARDARCR